MIEQVRLAGFYISERDARIMATMDTRLLANYLEELLDLENEYGAMKDQSEFHGNTPSLTMLNKSAIAWAHPYGIIRFSSRHKRFDELNLSYSRSEDNGFHPNTELPYGSKVKSVIAHEYGHMIAFYEYSRETGRMYEGYEPFPWLHQQQNWIEKRAREHYGYDSSRQARKGQNILSGVALDLSGYATRNSGEFLAEAFAAYRYGDGSSALGKAYGDWLNMRQQGNHYYYSSPRR